MLSWAFYEILLWSNFLEHLWVIITEYTFI